MLPEHLEHFELFDLADYSFIATTGGASSSCLVLYSVLRILADSSYRAESTFYSKSYLTSSSFANGCSIYFSKLSALKSRSRSRVRQTIAKMTATSYFICLLV